MPDLTLNIEVELNPTEDLEKVKDTIKNIFAPSSIELVVQNKKHMLIAKMQGQDGLVKFYTLVRQENIVGASRKVLMRGLSTDLLTFFLNKQAAYVNRISFCEPVGESPLGPIRIEIKTHDPKALINWLAPRSSLMRETGIKTIT